jgi:single-strand DNA-binding protein
MSRAVNKCTLLGSVGKDPVVRSTPSGTVVANFSLATNERHKDAQGNWVEETTWHNLTAFAKTAEIVRDYVKKGSHVYIEGRINTEKWKDKDSGQNRERQGVIINELVLLDGKPQSSSNEFDEFA